MIDVRDIEELATLTAKWTNGNINRPIEEWCFGDQQLKQFAIALAARIMLGGWVIHAFPEISE